MQKSPGKCGVCGKQIDTKVMVTRGSKDAATRPYCSGEGDPQHERAAQKGWDPYDPETPPRAS